jgi:hypothetical protein
MLNVQGDGLALPANQAAVVADWFGEFAGADEAKEGADANGETASDLAGGEQFTRDGGVGRIDRTTRDGDRQSTHEDDLGKRQEAGCPVDTIVH